MESISVLDVLARSRTLIYWFRDWNIKFEILLNTHTHTHTYIYIYVCVCVYIYIYIYDMHFGYDTWTNFIIIIIIIMSRHQNEYIWTFLATLTSRFGTELLYVHSNWSSCLYLSIWRGPQEYITYVFLFTSPAVSHMSGSSNLHSFRDGWLVALQLLLGGVLFAAFLCSYHKAFSPYV